MARIDGIGDRFETLLAERLRERDRAGRGQCPEVTLIAAYCDRSLAGGERDAVERHLAGCALCRAELSSITTAAHETQAARAGEPQLRRWWSSASVGLAVAGSIAAVVAIGLGRDYYDQEARAPAQLAMRTADRGAGAISGQTRELAARRIAPRAQMEANASVAAIPAAPPPAPVPFAEAPQGLLPRATGSSAVRPKAPMMMAGMGVNAGNIVAGNAVGGASAPSSGQQSRTFARPGWAYGSANSPDGAVTWKFGRHGTIERFVTNATTATHVPGVTSDLLAGSAPSSSVCWIVGRGGTILRTTDGIHWQKIGTPTSSDLVSVTAQGADSAIVIDLNSHRYATSDGGQTWQPQ
ncbi:MAG TPA: zf-HC2 domain-containing protein [Candidatus Binataceae bacterium]|nr:zf-HC2 domain-containing protein [Candidatus Binataceae bacterium]